MSDLPNLMIEPSLSLVEQLVKELATTRQRSSQLLELTITNRFLIFSILTKGVNQNNCLSFLVILCSALSSLVVQFLKTTVDLHIRSELNCSQAGLEQSQRLNALLVVEYLILKLIAQQQVDYMFNNTIQYTYYYKPNSIYYRKVTSKGNQFLLFIYITYNVRQFKQYENLNSQYNIMYFNSTSQLFTYSLERIINSYKQLFITGYYLINNYMIYIMYILCIYYVYYNYNPSNTIITRMSKAQVQLDYQIVDINKIYGEGSINSIKTQNGSWKSYIGTEKFKLKCKFRGICQLNKIQVKIENASILTFSCFLDEQQKYYEMKTLFAKERESNGSIIIPIKNQTEQISQIQINIDAHNKKQIIINSLRFYGTLISKFDKKQKLQIFNERNKKMAKRKVEQVKLNKQKVKQMKQDNEKQMQRQGTSRSQSSHSNILSPPSLEDQLFMNQQENQQHGKKYKIIAIKQSQLEALYEVSQNWLDQQRKLQINFGVKAEHKLSVLINPKCLANQKICIANIYYQQKSKYVKMAKELGAIVKEQPSQGCIVLTPNPKGSIIRLAKLMDNVAIVRLQYLQECYKHKIKLKTNKFAYSALQLLDL